MSLALYRKYRPGRLAEVKGQDHVTVPLRQALLNGRVHHAYLFSGPRGCGKTSSARILARSLNCEQGPTPDPCGSCASCVALAPNGPGSLDVIELDAASHGGVDDARDLRDKAIYAPVSSRYKVYIIDEAHMVTKEAFNALLKLVEEPPDFVKFVFATTEPDKVLQTIRSRTHHYPFRLMPRRDLTALLHDVVDAEAVPVEPAVLPLVVRAAAGSARDALSILDQVLASAGPEGVTREGAAALLGVTPDVLLDDVLDAFAVGDAATVFATVDQVMEGGHDPRRFAADVLERLRDLVILDAVPDAGEKGVLDCPSDQLERMGRQSSAFGTAGLSRAADLFHAGLTEMRGTTAPRLLLELLCARVLLPEATSDTSGVLTRLERVERRFDITAGGGPAQDGRVRAGGAQVGGVQAGRSAGPRGDERRPGDAPASARPDSARADSTRADSTRADSARPDTARPDTARTDVARPGTGRPDSGRPDGGRPDSARPGPGRPGTGRSDPARPGPGRPDEVPVDVPAPGASPWPATAVPGGRAAQASGVEVAPAPAPARSAGGPGGLDAAAVRRAWDAVLQHVKENKRVTHARLLDASVAALEGSRLSLSFTTPTLARQFQEGVNVDYLREALQAVLGVQLDVVCLSGSGGTAPVPPAPAGRTARSAPEPPPHDGFAPGDEAADDDETPAPAAERGDEAALRLVEQALGGRVVSRTGD